MRRILVDHARKHKAGKRGGNQENVDLEESIVIVADNKSLDLVRLDPALKDLSALW